MKCKSCDSCGINGVLCHETGCPDSHIDLGTGQPYPVECKFCGSPVSPPCQVTPFCSNDCAQAYLG